VRVYRILVEVFPDYTGYVHLVLADSSVTLIDAGSGFEPGRADLLAGFDEVRDRFGEKVSLADVQRVIVTHGHIDHFGGLPFIREHSQAQFGVQALDLRVLTNYEERVVVASKDLAIFLKRAGVSPRRIERLLEMYQFAKNFFSSVQVDFVIEDEESQDGLFRFYHTPGHCPGQICVQVEDLMFTSDHVLPHTSPHQAPESITAFTGLGHYLESLRKLKQVPGVRLALGGHEEPLTDLYGRIAEIERLHQERLEQVLDICKEPHTINEISKALFHEVSGYEVLLAVEEAGAHVEYLYQHGKLAVHNLEELETQENPPILYRRL